MTDKNVCPAAGTAANGGQRILDNLPPPAANSSTTLKHAAASCKRADYDWTTQIIGLIFGPLCNRVLGESVCVCVCFDVRTCVLLVFIFFFFFLWTKMITQRRKCSIYRMSPIEWPGNFPRPDGRMLSSCAKLCLKAPACSKMNLDPSNFKMRISKSLVRRVLLYANMPKTSLWFKHYNFKLLLKSSD